MENSDDLIQIDSPIDLLPDLSARGIDEIDKGVCEDTAENRQLIRENKSRFTPVYDDKGGPTNLIQVITPEMVEARRLVDRKSILSDRRNVDSDFITGTALLIEPDSDRVVPAWVLAATRRWEDVEDRRRTQPNFRPALVGPPSRCRAKKIDGHRCHNWQDGRAEMDGLCRLHVTSYRKTDEEFGASTMTQARNRVQSAALMAVSGLESLAQTATSEPVRLAAMNSLLDRAGLRGGVDINTEVNVHVVPAADIVKDRLKLLSGASATANELTENRMNRPAEEIERGQFDFDDEDVEYAEVVEDDERRG